MSILGPTRFGRLNEAFAFLFLLAGLFFLLSLVSYHVEDSSWNVATGALHAHNLTGPWGAYVADLCLQTLGFAAVAIPAILWILALQWVRSKPMHRGGILVFGGLLLLSSVCTGLALMARWWSPTSSFGAGGALGTLLCNYFVSVLNVAGTLIVTVAVFVASLYLISKFSLAMLLRLLRPFSFVRRVRPLKFFAAIGPRWKAWRASKRRAARARAREKQEQRASAKGAAAGNRVQDPNAPPFEPDELPRWPLTPEPSSASEPPSEPELEEIPIRELEYQTVATITPSQPEPLSQSRKAIEPEATQPHIYELPPTELLNEIPERGAYDSAELKETAVRIKSKFAEFNVQGTVVQINPGPVVTTFELKPEAGVKYSRITALNEDLCLGLQAESILIERIPGKPTVGIEVPNSKREVISLRQILESEEFNNSPSKMTICLGKDISGRIKVGALESMPHLLIAGSTGSGKSVMLNSMIMSILYKATPEEVRMILVDPKRVEMGIYEGIPHLLVPVITDAKRATIALRNAVLEMERRLKTMASIGVRNIDQYNRKVRQMMNEPRALFGDDEPAPEELKPMPFILIVIDELADLMMLERANVEEAVTRLAQMARAVGMHLVLATQRPSVDVITGLIKANFPARISFRVATRVDSRTVLDVMGAEHLLGKGDMLFLPPGSSRLVRVHAAFVTETETNRVVECWKKQARPDYDQTFLIPPADEDSDEETGDLDGTEDPMYQDAVRVVLELGKASTSTLQRRLRLGYGRAARILDMMQREGIIGPPDGSKPREVLKRPDWLTEVERQYR